MQTYPLKIKTTALPFSGKSVPLKFRPLRKDILRRVDALGSTAIGVTASAFAQAKKQTKSASALAAAYYPFLKKYARTALIGMLILDGILFLNVARIIHTPFSPGERGALGDFLVPSVSAAETAAPMPKLGTETTGLVSALKAEGVNVSSVYRTTKPGLSVSGNVLAVGGDSISVFEYANQTTASDEALALAQSYANDGQKDLWATRTYVYTRGGLVIFYLGNNEALTASIAEFAGNSLVDVPLPPSVPSASSGI